jgi:hypothetical protein
VRARERERVSGRGRAGERVIKGERERVSSGILCGGFR